MIVLGLHKDPWHSTGAAMIRERDGQVELASLSEERRNREKDSRRFPELSCEACMRTLGVESLDEVDLIVLDHIVSSDWRRDQYRRPCDTDTFLHRVDPRKILVINHHLAHACSVFYSSPFASAAVLVVDGRGSAKETQSLFMAGPDGIRLVESTTRIGIGLLYAAVTQLIGFGLLEEGKTMGLAPYGAGAGGRLLDFRPVFDGIATDYGAVCIEDSYEMRQAPQLSSFERKARAAFEVQEECERALLHLADYARRRTGAEYLCISGGVGLNSVANYRVLQSGIFTDIFINPATSDTGIPLGAALFGYHEVLKRPRTYRSISPYLGPAYEEEEIVRATEPFRGATHHAGAHGGFTLVRNGALERAASLLAQNRIVACWHGRSEMGPRALGNRSILMSPLRAENKDHLNARVKHREPFRPFAPAMLEEHMAEYFELDRPSPYMLLVPYVREEKRQAIPAVTHVDGTGRLQTVARDFNPHFHGIIEAFHQLTGVPVILNTSFNVNGEPIVESPGDAMRCFLATQIDALLLGDHLLVKDAT